MMTTTYLGLELRSPLVASAGPLTQTVSQIERLADTGIGAIVLHSLYAEQIRRTAEADLELEESYADSFAEATSYFPTIAAQADPASSYLSLVERSAAVIDVPLIASLNAAAVGDWTQYARRLADAGAAAIECNIYLVPGDVQLTGADVDARHREIVAAVTSAVDVPVAVKLSPFLSSLGNLALQLVDDGAAGLVLCNRFLQPQVRVSEMAVVPGVELSTSADGHVARTWIATLRQLTSASLAGSSGVHNAEDFAAYLLAGADVVMTTSALVRHGIGHATRLLEGLDEWMQRSGYRSLDDVRGKLAVPADTDGYRYARSGYLAALERAQSTYGSLQG